jgi:divalent metal cation (Fe/Co/Zn/Cd) transporter
METDMEQLTHLRRDTVAQSARPTPANADRSVMWLQSITLGWMLVECAGAIFASSRAHSVALLAFGSDSLVELFSATIVLFQFTRIFRISRERAARMAGDLLFVLAGVVGLIALAAMAGQVKAERSLLGISITAGALVLMPILAWLKRRKAIETGDRALAADAVQSATCAYLAAITLAALCLQVFFPLRWLDPLAALCAIPILIVEGRRARMGESCGCC